MQDYTIYHNPRCSKSRQALSILEDKGITPTIRLYLQDIPSASEIERLLELLGMKAKELLRQNETAFATYFTAIDLDDDKSVISLMRQYPIVIERPIIISQDRAVIARPAEAVLQLIGT